MRVPIAYALHHPDRVDVPVPDARPRRGRRARRSSRPTSTRSRACGWRARPPQAGGTATCVLNAANEVAVHAFLVGPARLHGHPGGDRDDARAAARRARALLRHALRAPTPRRGGCAAETGRGARVSWLLAFLGFAALIILHELGHFTAAKAVGMRVERFSLFFPPLLARVRRGETEYAIGVDPAGRLREDHRHEPGGGDPAGGRAPRLLPPAGVEADRRDRAPGPAVNIALAFLLLVVIFLGWGVARRLVGPRSRRVDTTQGARRRCCSPATASSPSTASAATPRPCATRSRRTAAPARRSTAARPPTPARVTVVRDGRERTFAITPVYERGRQAPAARLQLGSRARSRRSGRRRGRRASVEADVGVHDAGPSRRSPASSRPRSARRSPASSAPTRRRARRSSSQRRPRGVPARGDLALARDHQPVPVPAARRRPHLLGAGREGARPRDPVQRHGARRVRRLRARDRRCS